MISCYHVIKMANDKLINGGNIKVREHEQISKGQWRKAHKPHSCDIVYYFGLKPHNECGISPNLYYWNTNENTGEPFKTYKICRYCADMNLETAHKLSRGERDAYKK